jgi:hypothetical protein
MLFAAKDLILAIKLYARLPELKKREQLTKNNKKQKRIKRKTRRDG